MKSTIGFPPYLCRLVALVVVATMSRETVSESPGLAFYRQPPQFVDFSNSTGSRVECLAHGDPSPTVKWVLADGAPVTEVARLRYALSNGTLLFWPFRAEDYRQDIHAAIYRCQATSSAGIIVSRPTRIRAVVMQLYEVQVYDEFVISGNTAVLKCHVPTFISEYVSVTSWIRDPSYHGSEPVISGDKYTVLPTGELHIRDVRSIDSQSMYRCQTTHRLTGETRLSSTAGRLIVTDARGSVPPRITDSKPLIYGREGDSVTLPCASQGHPVPLYRWLFRNQGAKSVVPVSSGKVRQVGGNLIIENLKKSDSGSYECSVNNSVGSEKVETLLTVVAPLSAFIRPQHQVVDIGRATTLNCVASGYPITSITWMKNGRPLPPNTQSTASWESLRLESVAKEDRGMYQCFVSNDWETVEANAELLLGDSMPSLVETFQERTVHQGLPVALRCVTSGTPLPAFMWQVDEIPLPLDDRYRVEESVDGSGNMVSVLSISGVKPEDGGVYKCAAKNRVGAVEFSAMLNVFGPPVIRALPAISSVSGQNLTLRCPVSRYPVESIVWQKDGKTIPLNRRQVVFPNGTLHLRTVQRNPDAGKYTCIVRSKDDLTTQRDFQIRVLVPPRWITEPRDLSVTVGKLITLDCQADGYPHPVITWMKAVDNLPGEYRELYDASAARITLGENGTLVIGEVLESDEGKYLCQATNGIGAGLSTVIFLDVQVPARFERKFANVTSKRGGSSKLACKVTGDRPIDIVWGINGRKLGGFPSTRFHVQEYTSLTGVTSELVINQVERSDSATYTCWAKNHYGRDETSFTLAVQERPEFPMGLKIIDQNSRSIQVAWLRPYDGNSPVLRYVLQYKRISGGWNDASTNVTVPGSETGVTVQGLQPSSAYHFRVFAENDVGSSDPSEAVVANSTEEAPSGMPQDVQVRVLDSQTVKVSWKPPKKDLWNGPIRGYHVGYKLSDSSEPFVFKTLENHLTGGNTHHAELIGLKKFTRYSVVVQAFNHVGSGPKSEEVSLVTAEDVPTTPPTDVKCSPLSSQSLHVSWEPPPSASINGLLQGYKVVYKPTEEWYDPTQFEAKVTPASKTTLHGLQKHANYSIQVLAFTRVGDGDRSDTVYCRTFEDVPDAPADIKAVVNSHDSILVTWKEPIHSNGIVTKYTVYMRTADHGKEDTIKHSATGGHLQFEAQTLKKNTRYDFWITAATSVGEGQSTRVISQTLKTPMVPAKAISFDSEIIVPYKNEVELPCKAVGKPLPEKSWKYGDKSLESSDRFRFGKDGILKISDVQVSDAGVYTCNVRNSYGSDDVKYKVIVQVPPSPPSLGVLSATHATIELNWKAGTEGGDNIRGYTIHYKRDYGEWEMLRIRPEQETYTLLHLECGTRYQLYMTAFNRIGKGSPSDVIFTKTKGSPPEGPPMFKLVRTNSTFVTLRLEAWSDGGCPILHFVVEYRPRGDSSWRLVANNVHPSQALFVIPDLNPATWYNLRVTAHNSAGSTHVEYDFATHTITGDALSTDTVMNGDEANDKAFLLNLSLLALIGAALGVVVLVTLLACLCVKRRRHTGRKPQAPDGLSSGPVQSVELKPLHGGKFNTNLSMGSFTCLLRGSEQGKQRLPNITRNCHQDGHCDSMCEDVTPYATSQLPGCKENHEKFSHRHYIPDLPPRNHSTDMTYSTVRKQVLQYCQRPDTLPLQNQVHVGYATDDSYPGLTSSGHTETLPTMYALLPSAPIYGDHHVPDLLDHRQESSSPETSPESRRRTFPHYGTAGHRISGRAIASPTMADELSKVCNSEETSFVLSPSRAYGDRMSPSRPSQRDRWNKMSGYTDDKHIQDFQRLHFDVMQTVESLQSRYQSKMDNPTRNDVDNFKISV